MHMYTFMYMNVYVGMYVQCVSICSKEYIILSLHAYHIHYLHFSIVADTDYLYVCCLKLTNWINPNTQISQF